MRKSRNLVDFQMCRNRLPTQGRRLDNFCCYRLLNVTWLHYVKGKLRKREKNRNYLFARFRPVLLRSYATRCYAVNQWYFHLLHNTSVRQNGRLGLKLLEAPGDQRNFPLWSEMGLVCRNYKRGPKLGTLWQFWYSSRTCKLQLRVVTFMLVATHPSMKIP